MIYYIEFNLSYTPKNTEPPPKKKFRQWIEYSFQAKGEDEPLGRFLSCVPQTRLITPHPHPTVGIAQRSQSWARVNASNLRILWMDAGALLLTRAFFIDTHHRSFYLKKEIFPNLEER